MFSIFFSLIFLDEYFKDIFIEFMFRQTTYSVLCHKPVNGTGLRQYIEFGDIYIIYIALLILIILILYLIIFLLYFLIKFYFFIFKLRLFYLITLFTFR